jgi:hypothetical protein
VSQGRIIRQRDISSMNSHTHGPERVFVPDCPACIRSNVFRDMNSLFTNE